MEKGKEGKSASPYFHSGESRNLILATARIFREAEHCNGRLSANAASPQRFLPTQEWKGLLIRRPFCLSSPSFHSRPLSHSRPSFHSRESGNLPDSLTVHASRPKIIRRQGDSRFRGNGNVFFGEDENSFLQLGRCFTGNIGIPFPPLSFHSREDGGQNEILCDSTHCVKRA